MKNTRRDFIKNTALLSAGLSMSSSYGLTIINKPRLKDGIIGHGDFTYKVHKEWGNLNPLNTPVKNCHEMVMDSKGRLIMVTDHVKNNVIVYDKSGKLLTSWTHNLKRCHGLTLFNEGGEDVLFITDNGGRVIKTTIDGKVILELPNPKKEGLFKSWLGYSPTETAVAPNGDIYIADGYGSDYIFQFDKDGNFIRKFGGRGHTNETMVNAHGVAIDARDPNNITLMVTSRTKNCFKRFTLDGKFLETIYLPGSYVCRPVFDGENLYSGVCWSRLEYNEMTPNSGFVTILDKNNKVVSNPGGAKPKYKCGALEMMVQETPIFNHCHDVCVDEDKNLYVCQWNANKTYPIKLERV